jgi:hypothetical protein
MLILVVFALALECGVMRAEDIQVEKWPEDVPCDAIKKNPDGSYTQTKDLIMDRIRMEKNTFVKDSPEARAWDRKCAGKSA